VVSLYTVWRSTIHDTRGGPWRVAPTATFWPNARFATWREAYDHAYGLARIAITDAP
jgi:hypothetical protein